MRETGDDLVKLGKKLKKNNIAVDIVNFGEEAENVEKLEAFIKAVNTSDERYSPSFVALILPFLG